VPGSLTRRQLLIRTGGASVALACFGALPTAGAIADPAALTPARAATYAALLDAIDADPAYSLAQREELVGSFASRYTDDALVRAYADPVLDALGSLSALSPQAAHAAVMDLDGRLKPDALSLAALAFDLPEDTHTIVFTV
jgi:hypothetical protein